VDDIEVRTLRAAERDAVAALWDSVFGYAEARNDPALVLATKLGWDERVLVAVLGSRVLGTAMVGYDGHRGWLYRVAVAGDARRSGVGSLLVRAAEAELCALGCAKVNLQLHVDNPEGQAFWRALGYQVEPRVSMGKELSPRPATAETARG
jgi:ribosomal protein S18 acetylase RimI-like enzyme